MRVGLTRRNIGRLILLGWAVVLAWLARREYSKGEQAELTERATRLSPSAQYFAVSAGGRQIGQLNLTVDTLVDGVRLTEMLLLGVPTPSGVQPLARVSAYSLTRSLKLQRFTRTISGLGPQSRIEGELEPDSLLRLEDRDPGRGVGGRSRHRYLMDDLLPAMIPFRVAFGGRLRIGPEFTLPVIDLRENAAVRRVTMRVSAESTFVVPDSAVWDSAAAQWVPATMDTITAWRLEHDADGSLTVSWVDGGGVLVHQVLGSGVTLTRSAFEIVRNNYMQQTRSEDQGWRREIPGMVTLIAAGRRPDSAPPRRTFLIVTDSGSGGWAAPRALAGGRQQLRGDTLVVSRTTPVDATEEKPAGDTAATWEIPAAEVELSALTSRVVRGAPTGADSARRILEWVFRQTAIDAGPTGSNTAMFTFRTRRGTAIGKARLFAGMARAVHLPARVVSGLAVLPEGSFGHVWCEVWLGRWVAVDPTFGHFPASASLVRLALGGGDWALELVPIAGSARFLPIRDGR
jgi:hypothetical protein